MDVLDAGESEPQRARPVAVGRASIRLAAALMALLVLASIGGVLAHERSQTLAQAAALSERRAGRLAGELGDALAVAAAAVQRIEARLEQVPNGESVSGVLATLLAEQRPLLAALPLPLRLVAVDADGRSLAADVAASAEPETLPAADGWQVGLTRGAAGSRSIPVLRRAVPHRHGVAAFLVELDHAALVARLESSRTLPAGGAAVFLIEADGSTTLLARAPLVEAEIGQRLHGPLAQALPGSPRGWFNAPVRIDDVRRTVAYQRLDGELAELVVAYGLATDQVLADWRALLPWAAGAALLLLGGIGAGVRRLEAARQVQADQLQALQRSENQFRALAANVPDVVVRVDRDGRHLFANPAVEQATGLLPQAFVCKTHAELGMPADRVEQWTACLRRVFTSGLAE
ncbi:MAG: PAS domain S-box protein, partial [Rubrivivax sp.]|nr:PAS domain S-box protein [Rubrivivax sp.]